MENKRTTQGSEAPEIIIDEVLVEEFSKPQDQKNNLLIPASIILAGFMIATGIYMTNRGDSPSVNTGANNQPKISLNPVSKTEHIRGNPDAAVIVVEYSDTECPFCKMFQTTMQSVMETYGKDGKVAWVYRPFPIDSLHSKARIQAEATECVNDLGGNTAYWKMLDSIYENTPSNNGLDSAKLPIFAKAAGVDVTAFNTCLSSGKHVNTVEAYIQDGMRAGVQGTPYSVLVLKNKLSSDSEKTLMTFVANNGLSQNVMISETKKEVVMNGALPLQMVQTIIDAIVK